MAVLAGKLAARPKDCAPLAGKSTLNRLELGGRSWMGPRSRGCLSICFWRRTDSRRSGSSSISTDDPLHGHQSLPRRRPGRPLLSRLLRLLLLSAAVRLLRIASAGGQTALRQHRRRCRCGRGDGAHRRADPHALACGAHRAARRCGVCARGADDVVRAQRRRFSRWLGQERAPGRRDCQRARYGRGGEQSQRPAGTPVQGIPVVDARQLEPPAPCREQGGMDRRCGHQSALCRHLAERRGCRAAAAL